MISKKLIHDIITFHNNFINNKNVIAEVCVYCNRPWISTCVYVCTLSRDGSIDKKVADVSAHIHDEEDFKKYKQNVLDKIPDILKNIEK